VFDCDVEDALLILISLDKHETWSSFILISCKQILGVKRAAILWWAPGGTQPRYVTAWTQPVLASSLLALRLNRVWNENGENFNVYLNGRLDLENIEVVKLHQNGHDL